MITCWNGIMNVQALNQCSIWCFTWYLFLSLESEWMAINCMEWNYILIINTCSAILRLFLFTSGENNRKPYCPGKPPTYPTCQLSYGNVLVLIFTFSAMMWVKDSIVLHDKRATWLTLVSSQVWYTRLLDCWTFVITLQQRSTVITHKGYFLNK